MKEIVRFWHTVRYLKPIQIFGRVWFRIYRPRPDLRAAPPLRSRSGPWMLPIARPASLLGPTTFRFLNVSGDLEATGWDSGDVPKLWRYNLHYFDDLSAIEGDSRLVWQRNLIQRWVAENAPGRGTGWEPFPTSLRLVNWIKWLLNGFDPPAGMVQSLAVQARWLSRRLEVHLLGNHLIANAKALVFAGCFFEGKEADEWKARGLQILDRELLEQVLVDGGHFERSPMYHAAILEDVLDLTNILRAYGQPVPNDWMRIQRLMLRWARALSHPDGGIAFFNDAAFGIAPSVAELEHYAARLELPVDPFPGSALEAFEASGYVRAVAGAAVLLCDCGDVGPDYLPAHAHADSLSFELSLNSERIFVNSGTSEYGVSTERQRQRGSAAHNTIVVNDLNSSDVWAGFRVGRRARVQNLSWLEADGRVEVSASHDGYGYLAGRNSVTRKWELADGELTIADSITGVFATAEARFHLHPHTRVQQQDSNTIGIVSATGVAVSVTFSGAGSVAVQPSTWHPEFGASVPSSVISARFAGNGMVTRIVWRGLP